jgi:hypothetical protein
MAPKTQKERGFDNAKLQAMHEPLTVRVVKIKANTKQPIEIPGKDGQAPGCGLGREDVLKLEGFIREWSGGGYYEGQVTDANGLSMEWPFGWDPRLYPEKIPPTDTQNVNIGTLTSGGYAPLPAPMMMPMQMSPTSAIPNLGSSNIPVGGGMIAPPGSQPLGQGPQGSSWPPPSGAYMQYPQQTRAPWLDQQPQQQQQPAQVPTPAPIPYPAPYQQPGIADFSAGRRFQGDSDRHERERADRERDRTERDRDRLAAEERARGLEDQLRRADLERKEIEHKAMLQQQAQQHAADMAAMRDEIRRISETNKVTENDEIRRMRDEKDRAERAAERQAVEQRFNQLQELIARSAERAPPPPVVDTSAIDKMREMERKLEQERHERDRLAERERAEREREKERYEREREREKFEQQLLQMQATQAQALANLQSNRPDPMVELMREQARMQAETAREIARAQDVSATKMAAFMVNPMEMMRVIKDSSQGSDQMIRNIVDSFSGVFGTYRAALESVAQLQGAGAPSPMVGIIQDGLSHGKDVMEQWMNMQRDKGVAEAKAKQAEANASGMQAQAAAHRASLEAQRMGTWQAPPQVQQQAERPATPEEQARYDYARQQMILQQQAAAANGGGLNGHAPPAPVQVMDVSPQALGQVAPTPNPVEQVQAEIVQAAANIDPNKLPELITAADIRVLQHPVVIESVSRLRKGVRAYVESKGKKDPKTKKHIGLKPEEAANAILQGVTAVHQNKISVPAFSLFTEQRFADMSDLLLVGSPQSYRDEVAQILRARALGEVPDVAEPAEPELRAADSDGDDADDDDGEDDGDEDQPGA